MEKFQAISTLMALSESDPGTFWIIVLAICLAGNYFTNYVIMLRGHEGAAPQFHVKH
jgi:hypothetical protein